jgi:hypothetical protein
MERQREAEGFPLATEFAALHEQECGACDVGTGERHVATLPTFPRYEVLRDGDAVPPPAETESSLAAVSETEDAVHLAEFSERLARNSARMGLLGPDAPGAGLWRKKMDCEVPRRPKEGWSLLVTPLGLGPRVAFRGDGAGAFVAKPGGERRELNVDEKDLLRSERVKPRRKLPA